MLTLDTKNADPYKSKSTWLMITRTVMEDASIQSIHHKARHTVINVVDIKQKWKNSKVLFDKLPVAQLLKTPYLSRNPIVYSRLHNSPKTRFYAHPLKSTPHLHIPVL